MEPRGCNAWQSVANRVGAKAAEQAETVAAVGDQLPEAAQGKPGLGLLLVPLTLTATLAARI
jgi:hypothetical protein